MKEVNSTDINEWGESVSTLMDGESHDLTRVVNCLKSDRMLRLKWQRYHVIKDVLQDALGPRFSVSFPDRVMQALNREPTILAPARRDHHWVKAVKPFVGIGIAAAVASFTFYGLQNFHQQTDIPVINVAERNVNESSLLARQTRIVDYQDTSQHPSGRMRWEGSQDELQELLNDYLMNHTEYSAVGSMHGLVPYVRVAGFDGSHQ